MRLGKTNLVSSRFDCPLSIRPFPQLIPPVDFRPRLLLVTFQTTSYERQGRERKMQASHEQQSQGSGQAGAQRSEGFREKVAACICRQSGRRPLDMRPRGPRTSIQASEVHDGSLTQSRCSAEECENCLKSPFVSSTLPSLAALYVTPPCRTARQLEKLRLLTPKEG